MKGLFGIACVLAVGVLAGCATRYDVVLCNPDGVCSEAHIRSYRDFEQPIVKYDRMSGKFEFGAASAERAISPLEYAAADIARAAAVPAAAAAAPEEE